jgi:hypothetical protein
MQASDWVLHTIYIYYLDHHLGIFAEEGLRTLVLARKEVSHFHHF